MKKIEDKGGYTRVEKVFGFFILLVIILITAIFIFLINGIINLFK